MQDPRLVQLARPPQERERVKSLGVIDIGSNTLLLTLGRKEASGEVRILLDRGEVVRLSEGLKDGGRLQPEAKERTLETLREFKRHTKAHGISRLVAAGTAAFRRAADGADFARQIERELEIPVRILSGDEEAAYSFQSAAHDFGSSGVAIGMIDIGGGSTEWVFGEAGPRVSFPIGTVRLTEELISKHPIDDETWKRVRKKIQIILKSSKLDSKVAPKTWVAVAATPASLAAVLLELPTYQPEKVHGFKLGRSELEKLIEKLRTSSIPERNRLPGMDPKRSELLPVGGAILAESMKFLNLDRIIVSDHGLRYGILHESL